MNDFEHTLASARCTEAEDPRTLRRALGRLYRTGQRGVTLVEVLIVVTILAMVAGGVALYALPKYQESQIKMAKAGARTIRQAIQSWQATNNETTCPTVSQLVADKDIDSATNTKDPWGSPYTLSCTDDEVIVSSAGPDKKKGTKDDIQIPEHASTGDSQ